MEDIIETCFVSYENDIYVNKPQAISLNVQTFVDVLDVTVVFIVVFVVIFTLVCESV